MQMIEISRWITTIPRQNHGSLSEIIARSSDILCILWTKGRSLVHKGYYMYYVLGLEGVCPVPPPLDLPLMCSTACAKL